MHKWWQNYGPWGASVKVNGQQVDWKLQPYPPHGSVNPADAGNGQPLLPGQIVRIDVAHGYFDWVFWPEWTPEGWKWRGQFFPKTALGFLQCVIPAW